MSEDIRNEGLKTEGLKTDGLKIEGQNAGASHHDSTALRSDTSKVLDELSRNSFSKNSLHDRRKRGLRRFLIILVLLVPVLLTLSWLAYQQVQINAELALLRTENTALQSAVANASAIESTSPQPAFDPQLLDALRSDLEARIESLASVSASLQERLAAEPQERGNEEWLWTELEYLLRLANQKLQLEGDTESALLLLTTVDTMLSNATAPALFTVREAIAREILAVRSIEAVDVAGLYASLNNLVPLVDSLSLRNALVQNYNAQLAQQRTSAQTQTGLMARSMELLRSVFVWQRWDEAPEALLPPQQEAVLKHNLQLLLEQAKLALLMEEQQTWRDSLARGNDWVALYFAIDAGAGRTLREELSSLAQINIVQERPDISGSLGALLQISENRLAPVSGDGN